MNVYLRFFLAVMGCILCGVPLQSATTVGIGIDTVLTQQASIGRTLWIRVDATTRSSIASKSIDYNKVRLLLNGVQFSTIVPRMKTPDVLAFPLVYDSTTASAWRMVLGTQHTRERTVTVALSTTDTPVPREPPPHATTTLVLYGMGTLLLALASVGLVALIIVVLGRRTALLRDGDATTTYSLAQCQMALWFVLVFAAYLFIAIVTKQWNGIINNTALVLIGIGAAIPTATTTVQTIRDTKFTPQETTQFAMDILSNANKPRLHRLQCAIWNTTLAGVFCCAVWNNLAMPEFSTELLTLLGISSGAYVTLRETE